MLPRSSRPDPTLVEKPPQFAIGTNSPKAELTAKPPQMAAPNVIPFARPRSIAAAATPAFSPPKPPLPAPKTAAVMPAVAPRPAPPAPPPAAPPALAPEFRAEAPTMIAAFPVKPSLPPPMPVAPLPAPMAAPAKPASKWAAFEKLGLVADPKKLSKHVVTAYRMLGFGILTIIVMVLVGYIATTIFFYCSDSWIVPMAISPTDEKVVSLEAQLAERQNNRDRLAADLEDANRAIVMQQAFQAEFAKAIASDLDGRRAALERMHQLASAAASTRVAIRNSNNAFASASSKRMAEEYKAGLIDRQSMLSGKFQLAQISTSNLSLVERQAEYEDRAADLEGQTRSLESLLANTKDDSPMSYDVLKIKQEYEASRLATDKAIGLRDSLKTAVEREDKMLETLKQTGYLRAVHDHAQVAFVPYGNLHKVDRDTSLYGCKLGMVFCHKVGTVLEVLPGEVQFKHPHRDKMLRGQMVELKLEDGAAATDDVLFVGGRPLLF